MTSDTHLVQSNQIGLGSFFSGNEPVLLIRPNGFSSMAIQAGFINGPGTRFQLMVTIHTGNLVVHCMPGMIENHLVSGVHITGGNRIFINGGNLGFGIAGFVNLKQENR
jgi:hypothetical protein